MKNNSNLLLAVVIVVVFIFLWDNLVVKRYGPPKPTTSQNQNSVSQPSAPQSSIINASIQKASIPMKEANILLHSETANVTMESQGARVSSWKIKERNHWIELISSPKVTQKLPLETLSELNFKIESSADNQVVYAAVHPSGFQIKKTLTLSTNSSLHLISLEFKNPSKAAVSVDTSFGWEEGLGKHMIDGEAGKQPVEARILEMRAIAYSESLHAWKPGMLFSRTVDQIVPGPFEWIGVDNNHFLAALVGQGEKIPEVKVFADRSTAPSAEIPLKFNLAPGELKTFTFDLYVGPKKTSELKAVGHHLDQAINFGVFGVISKALLHALEFFKLHTGNYGWAIIILTICLQIAVFPLTKRSLEHSVKMKELQPQMKQLQAQYKSDPKRLQIETLNLYKKQGMHFMGLEGCFPILLQIPVFFAFYSALNGAYELRGAPWIFWIKDLAAPDPYHVLPVLMGIGMFIQQKITTVPTDPAQANMMMIMPVVFVFMFFKMPAGLVLYWSINSVCTIVGQRLLRWQRESRTPSSP